MYTIAIEFSTYMYNKKYFREHRQVIIIICTHTHTHTHTHRGHKVKEYSCQNTMTEL